MTTRHTTESVERLAATLERHAPDVRGWEDGETGEPIPFDEDLQSGAATLRDLADERDALRARLDEAVEIAELNQADAEKAAIAGGCMDRFGIPISIRARGNRIAKLRAFLNGGGNG